jgi:3D (Asp-Asp-Asp) domain-containing protein
MKTQLKVCFLSLLGPVLIPSCAYQQQAGVQFNKLNPGETYEVRKAVSASTAFKPHLMTSYFFIVDSTYAPMIATTDPAGDTGPAQAVSPHARAVGQFSNVRTTAYCHNEADHLQYGHRNAIGTRLKYGSVRSAAADWSRYPVGTRFRITSEPGIVYEVDDYGSALVGTGTIDLYKPTQGQMNTWGVRNVDIEVIQWGSLERSRQYLQGRTGYPHVRQMFYNIERRLNSQAATSTRTTPVTAMSEPSTVAAPGRSPSI